MQGTGAVGPGENPQEFSWERMSKVIPPTFRLVPVWQGGHGEGRWVIPGLRSRVRAQRAAPAGAWGGHALVQGTEREGGQWEGTFGWATSFSMISEHCGG